MAKKHFFRNEYQKIFLTRAFLADPVGWKQTNTLLSLALHDFFFVSFLNKLFGFPVFNSTLLNDLSCKRERSEILRSRSSTIVLLTTNWAEEIMFWCKTLEHNHTSVFYYQAYENFYLQFKCKKYLQIT